MYGPRHTRRAKSIEVFHHTHEHGRRYTVDMSHLSLLGGLITKGRQQLRKWMVDNCVKYPSLKEDIAALDALVDTEPFELPDLDLR